jgi:hypothetical protein
LSAFTTGIGAPLATGDHFSMFVTPGTTAAQINAAMENLGDVSLISVDSSGLAEFSWNSFASDTNTAIAEVTRALGAMSGNAQGGTNPGNAGSPNAAGGPIVSGDFLSNVGSAISAWWKSLNFSIPWWAWLLVILGIVLLFGGVFLHGAGEGFGEGAAGKV